MILIRRIAASLAAFAALVGAAPPFGDDPARYALRLPVELSPGGGVQRLDLPGAVLAAAKTTDLSDVRIFDADGRAMPTARADVAAALRRDTLRPMPILAPADTLRVTGMALRLDASGRPRLAALAGTPGEAGAPTVAAYLFDARAVAGDAVRLVLDADLPAGQAITFTVEASADLARWREVGQTVIYRAPGDTPAEAVLPLAGAAIERDYLRVSWQAGTRLLAPVAIRSASLLSRASGGVQATVVDAALPALAANGSIDVAVPFATPIAWVDVRPTAGEALVPVRILARDDGEQPWRVLGAGVSGASAPIMLNGAATTMLRIEATSAAFRAAPALRIGFTPRALLFLAAGRPPYTLAVGQPNAADTYLPAATLAGQGVAPREARLSAPPARLSLSPPASSGNGRKLLLWAVLLAATAALGAMAWAVWRKQPAAPPQD
ncbi:DUF3999 family protein [Sphingomonas jatrophae]|uniref:DUF3999 domain-containing protein n=1 Tax=Sphingomonas jatrophae TaxID=1166337 RepID=A0A1I6KZ34_9SPHN|nr:DUF3999 family protein [Sphingomonas jatrophae]SFR96447.1 Protein of unknown function [Sphingomonas jatrophae]